MKIIGIDPGLNATGWGVIQVENKKISYLSSGTIKTNNKQTLGERLYKLHQGLSEVLNEYKPGIGSIEETFVNKNPQSSLSLSQARGALLLTLSIAGIKNIATYPANYIKKSITGDGHAEKQQMIKMVKYTLSEIGDITHNAADAIAVALCHAYRIY